MKVDVLESGKDFLISYLRDLKVNYEVIYPWRGDWRFVVLHSLRVENYARRIIALDKNHLAQEEVLITRLACILHDIGRIHQRENHALISKAIVSSWLNDNGDIKRQIPDVNYLLSLIENHSNKSANDIDYCSMVLKDADLLDEIGVMSIFMSANWLDNTNGLFFSSLNKRIINKELSFCDETKAMLKTRTAQLIINQKKAFIEQFINQLEAELCDLEEYERRIR